jgi:hypothetical protein
MKGNESSGSRLRYLELAAIDLSITALELGGYASDDRSTSGNPHEIMAQAVADLHHPQVELNERDQEIIAQIKELAGQLSVRTSLPELLEARGKIVNGG